MKHIAPLLLGAALLTGCAAHRLAKADMAHDRMAYARAAAIYEDVLPSHPQRASMLRAADAQQHLGNHKRAAHWYHAADTMSPLDAEARYQQARVLMALDRHEEAGHALLTVLQERPEHQAAQDLYGSCQGREGFNKDTTRFSVAELPIPGVKGAFSPVRHRHGLLIVTEREAGLDRSNPWNDAGFLELSYTEKHTLANWSVPEPIAGKVNGPYHEGPAVLSADGRTLYFTRSNYYKHKLRKDDRDVSHLKLFRAELQPDGSWGNIMAFAYNGEEYSVGHPALSADGRTLYFASDMPGSLGGSDIWRCKHDGTGWGAPENLGPVINTAGNELFPTLNGDVLYFSSTAHLNLGGLDILVAHPEGDGWSTPENLGYPINTIRDDMGLVMDSTGASGYLSSDRSGADRIHYFFTNPPLLLLDVLASEEGADGFLPNTELTLTELGTMEDTSIITGPEGRYTFKLEPDKEYSLKASHEGMITQSRALSTKGLMTNTTMQESFELQRVKVGDNFTLANIYYDYDKWDLRPASTEELDKVVKMLKDNPEITFELSAHTDSRGGDLYNLVLSDARANSAVNYLIQQGVNPDRIVARGYGEDVPVNGCRNGVECTEEEHQANRRTEFKVLHIGATAVR